MAASREGFDTQDLKEAKSLLVQLPKPSFPPALAVCAVFRVVLRPIIGGVIILMSSSSFPSRYCSYVRFAAASPASIPCSRLECDHSKLIVLSYRDFDMILIFFHLSGVFVLHGVILEYLDVIFANGGSRTTRKDWPVSHAGLWR